MCLLTNVGTVSHCIFELEQPTLRSFSGQRYSEIDILSEPIRPSKCMHIKRLSHNVISISSRTSRNNSNHVVINKIYVIYVFRHFGIVVVLNKCKEWRINFKENNRSKK